MIFISCVLAFLWKVNSVVLQGTVQPLYAVVDKLMEYWTVLHYVTVNELTVLQLFIVFVQQRFAVTGWTRPWHGEASRPGKRRRRI